MCYDDTVENMKRRHGQPAPLFVWHEMKEYAKAFYKSRAWKRTQEAYKRSRGGLCERCESRGLIVPGVIVHHKTYITPERINDTSITLNWDNLELLCRDCHAQEHTGREVRYKVDEFGRVTAK